MKVQRTTRSAAGGKTGQRMLMAEWVLAGAVALALIVHEFPSMRRELRIWRMAGGLRAGHRYP